MNTPSHKVEITVSNRTVIRILVIMVLTVLAFKVFGHVAHVLELIFIAFFLALALNPAVGWISFRLHIKSRAAATGVAYLAVVAVLTLFFTLIIPPFVVQTVNFVKDLPQTVSSLNDDSTTAGHFVQRYHLQDQVNGFSQSIKDRTKNVQEPVLSTASKVGSAIIALLTVFVLTFMMLVEGPAWIKRYWDLEITKKRENDKVLAAKMYSIVSGYINGQILLAFIGAGLGLVALLIASTLLHVSINAFALAGILLITGLIPLIGHILGAVIVVAACLFVSLPLAIIMAIFLLIHQQIENVTLQPYIQAKYNELTPLLVFIAALLGIGFGGLIGAFVSIPAAGCLKVLYKDYLSRKNEKDHSHA
ncbi:MAG: AI-2E family transporter [Candidatus Saccharimonadales bacterium]